MEAERTRVREKGFRPSGGYEQLFQQRADFIDRQLNGKIVVKSTDHELELTRQGWARWYLNASMFKETVLHDWLVFAHDIRGKSGKHQHQGGLVIFAVEGKGSSEVDGERIPWEAEDVILLPIKPGGVEHTHWNEDPKKRCMWLAFLYLPLWDHVASEMTQLELHPDFIARYGSEGFITRQVQNRLGTKFFQIETQEYSQQNLSISEDEAPAPVDVSEQTEGPIQRPSRTGKLYRMNLYEEILKLRDRQRAQRRLAHWTLKGKEIPWENNRQGIMRWYLHPLLDDVVIQTLILFSQEIPPDGHSGKFRYQGNQVIYILRGKGATVIDGVEHPWEAGDVVQLPIRRDGIVVQHFNRSPTDPCRFAACEPNHLHSAGVDRASGFELLEVHSHHNKEYGPQP